MNADNWKRYAEQGLIKAIEDYDIPTYIRDIAAEVKKENSGRGIYSIYGRRGGDDFEALPKGLCIVNGEKVLKKRSLCSLNQRQGLHARLQEIVFLQLRHLVETRTDIVLTRCLIGFHESRWAFRDIKSNGMYLQDRALHIPTKGK